MKTGVYVGSFDPVHKGHIGVIKSLLDSNYLDRIIVVPTNNYWHKKLKVDLDGRIAMLKKYETSKIIVDVKNNNYQYTYQVLDSIKKDNQDDEIFLIMGDDLMPELDKWEHLEGILKYEIIVMKRNSEEVDLGKFEGNEKFKIVEDYNVRTVSSTYIRKNLYKFPKNEMLKYLDEVVYDYIIANDYYKLEEGETI